MMPPPLWLHERISLALFQADLGRQISYELKNWRWLKHDPCRTAINGLSASFSQIIPSTLQLCLSRINCRFTFRFKISKPDSSGLGYTLKVPRKQNPTSIWVIKVPRNTKKLCRQMQPLKVPNKIISDGRELAGNNNQLLKKVEA